MAKRSDQPPHLIPYQGSKRALAPAILDLLGERRFSALYEPFAGSAAWSIAAARRGLADRYCLADSLQPLIGIWQRCLHDPARLSADYEALWTAQLAAPRAHYAEVREQFNRDADPVKLLYLLARCVKNAPRFARDGSFNQAADHRRKGRSPERMRRAAHSLAELLADRTTARCGDFIETTASATGADLIYLDPPWFGTTYGQDKRYHKGLAQARLVDALHNLNERGVAWLLSYDGRTGDKEYGEALPESLGAWRLEIDAGASSQATLSGRSARTYESLYVSPMLRTVAAENLARTPTIRPFRESLRAH